ncbi:MAG: Crp/Fnr family transcriptional regulator [Clostridiaceae bacterium]|nr:Crp/Fnr family transcriptional regulator [Clostridiaceae bacterium]
MENLQTNLFFNISPEEYRSMKLCLSARERSFKEGETIYTFEKTSQAVGIVLSGAAVIVRYELNGSRTILEHLSEQEIFGATLAALNSVYENVSVICETDCTVMFIDYSHIISPCAKACRCHHQLIQNMLMIISQKNLQLSERVELLSKRTIREKLLCYFLQQSSRQNAHSFTLPFTMSDLADYLSVDRSAMTRELKKMKDDGIIKVNRRHISICPQMQFLP